MAAHTITITESINVWGLEPSNRWGTVKWGQKWGGYNAEVVHTIFQRFEIGEIIGVTDSISLTFKKSFVETLDIGVNFVEIHQKDAAGYSYIFPLPTDDSEDRANSQWADGADPDSSWSTSSDPSTTWSDA